jgi:uncharacterized protein (TIGR03437 family)
MNCRLVTFATLAVAFANLAQSAATDTTFSPANLSFKYQAGAALPASQALQIKSTGTALNFTISIAGPLPYLAQWLSVSANSGTTPATLKVYVNPTGMPSGSYTGSIVINAPGAATVSQSVPVTLDVGDAPATLTSSTGALVFDYVTGGAWPPSQPLVLMTSGGALTASITLSGGTWLKASPTGSIALVGLPGTVTVSVDPTGLTPGAYTGKLTFASSTAANKSVSVNITLNVTAGIPTIAANGVWPPGVLVNSAATIVTITGTNFFATSVASIAGTALTTTALSSTSLLATIPATMLNTASSLSLIVSTPTAAAPSGAATFTVYGPGPQLWAVANSASYTTAIVSPGGIITIYGIGLGPAVLATFPGTDPIPTSLPTAGAATSVTIDGNPAPLLYTSATQVSCIVPYAVTAKTGSQVDLVLTYNGLLSTAFKVNVVDADPGVFTTDASGVGQGAILNYNATTKDYSVNGSSSAALKNSTVSIYITGFGNTTCSDLPTSLCVIGATEANLIAGNVQPAGAVSVTIDGQTAAVSGAQAPLGSVPGLLQINVTVPAAAKSGNSDTVVVTVAGAKSQARVTMAVK